MVPRSGAKERPPRLRPLGARDEFEGAVQILEALNIGLMGPDDVRSKLGLLRPS